MKRSLKTLLLVVEVAVLVLGLFYIKNHVSSEDREFLAATAESEQQEAYAEYLAVREQLGRVSLVVTERGETVGIYDLSHLGLLEQALLQADQLFDEGSKTDPAVFADWTLRKKEIWLSRTDNQRDPLTPELTELDLSAVRQDLLEIERKPAEDAYIYLENGRYVTKKEKAGTELNWQAVEQAAKQTLDGWSLTETEALQLEISDFDVYLPPAITADGAVFDYAAQLRQDMKGLTVSVELPQQTMVLGIDDLLYADDAGVVRADREALEIIVEQWAEVCNKRQVPYVFDGYVSGPVSLQFLLCETELDQEETVNQLEKAILQLESSTFRAPVRYFREGNPFAIEGTYVEVDVANQRMIYFVDGAVYVETDVVTGYPYGHWTPRGYFAVQNRLTDQWLEGPDYSQFVEYWVGYDNEYGIHDALWRSEFGGDLYLTDGSHGCVNTPTEAMKKIYEHIQVGTPVVIHN